MFEADISYGFPESICLKVKFGNAIQTGLFQSFDTHGIGSTGLEIYYRFGQKSRLLDQKPWYVMGGVDGYVFDVDYVKEYQFMLYPRAGRSLYLSKFAGINLDAGLGFPFGRNTGGGHLILPVLPTGSMSLFFRF